MNHNLRKNRYLQFVFYKVSANLKSEAARNYLSYLWWIFEPLMMMGVYYVAFGILLDRGTEDFVAYLLTGILPWLWLSRTVDHSSNCIHQNKGLLMKVHIPKIIFPAIVICQNSIKQLVIMATLLLFLLIYGVPFNVFWLSLPVVMVVQLFLITAVSYLFASIVPFFPDLKFIIGVGLQMLMFCSGIFYNTDLIPMQYQNIFFLNPIAELLRNYRMVLLYHQGPNWFSMAIIAILSFLVTALVMFFMRRYDRVYPRIVL